MTVIVTQESRTQIIQINRPGRRNAVDGPTAELLASAFQSFDEDDRYDVAILTGSSNTFCAGADLKAVASGQGNSVRESGRGPMGPTRMQLNKPVIAAIEGHAVAGGLELALWCDMRVAARNAILGVFCRRWGVPLVDGGTIRLARLVGQSRALDLILTGREVAGEEALHFGLVNRLVAEGDALEEALKLAAEISLFPQLCMRKDRQSLYEQWNLDMDAALINETRLGLEVIRSGETVEGAKRFASGKGRHGSFKDI
jgi:enoyl-CoA hydratase